MWSGRLSLNIAKSRFACQWYSKFPSFQVEYSHCLNLLFTDISNNIYTEWHTTDMQSAVFLNLFLKYFEDISPFWGHWFPCFGLPVISAPGFKARVDPLARMLCCLHATEPSDSPLVRYLLISWRCQCIPKSLKSVTLTVANNISTSEGCTLIPDNKLVTVATKRC